MKVLIIDPDRRFVAQATEYLEADGHLVIADAKATKPSHWDESWRPDLVIVAAELRETGILEVIAGPRDRPAVLLTGWMDRYDEAWSAWERGGDDLLIKPIFKTEEIADAVTTAMVNRAGKSTQRPLAVSVYIDPGDANVDIIKSVLVAISDLHEVAGGSGLVFNRRPLHTIALRGAPL